MARSSKKRDAIINAAISEFKLNGYEATSMDQISMVAEVSKRTVYNHFASKELLFDAIVMQMMAFVSTSVCVTYDGEKALAAQLTDFAEQEVALLSNPSFFDLAKVCMAEAMHNPERINKALTQLEGRDGDLASWISAATADGRLNVSDVQFAATQFFALLKAFCFWPQMVHGQAFPDEVSQRSVIDSAVGMFLGCYAV
ncbi:MAG: TetR/AcrR family transcriptional regulator [Algicola sp.]|nr:TetR/AcrR family transcriptional regulator [Algicola sp.]